MPITSVVLNFRSLVDPYDPRYETSVFGITKTGANIGIVRTARDKVCEFWKNDRVTCFSGKIKQIYTNCYWVSNAWHSYSPANVICWS